MKRLVIIPIILFIFDSIGYAQMGSGMTGEQKGEMKQQGMMTEKH
jgi:hypothetical protein